MEAPNWWFVVSGLFFAAGLLVLGVMGFVMVKILKLLEEMKPKLESISSKVESISAKVDTVASRVDGITESVQTTVHSLSAKTGSVADSAQLIASLGSKALEKYAPVFAILGVVLKGAQVVGGIRRTLKTDKALDRTNKK